MRHSFPLFQSHLDLAHSYWQKLVCPGDFVLDATCGNGHDTLILAGLISKKGLLYALDIEQKALDATEKLLHQQLPAESLPRIILYRMCHSHLPQEILSETLTLIVYNLGYLPGGDKQKTTQTNTTLQSLKHALTLLKRGGCISLTAYPGHEEGKREEEALVAFFKTLPPQEWNVCHHRFCNRKDSPSLFMIQRQTREGFSPS